MLNKTDHSDFNELDEISLYHLFQILLKQKFLILTITFLSLACSFLYSIHLPNLYTSSSILSPSTKSDSMSSVINSYSQLASIAGVNLPSESNSNTKEAVERIKSIDFFEDYILPNIKLEDLMALDYWDMETNTIYYDDNIFDQKTGNWVRDVKYPQQAIPSSQEAFKEFKEIFKITKDSSSGYVLISLDHESPYIAKEWVEIINININEVMRAIDINSSKSAIEFLKNETKNTNLTELRQSISMLLESQMQTLMMASVNKDYVFNIISSPIVSEQKSSPNRILILLLGLIIGFFIGCLVSISLHFFKDQELN